MRVGAPETRRSKGSPISQKVRLGLPVRSHNEGAMQSNPDCEPLESLIQRGMHPPPAWAQCSALGTRLGNLSEWMSQVLKLQASLQRTRLRAGQPWGPGRGEPGWPGPGKVGGLGSESGCWPSARPLSLTRMPFTTVMFSFSSASKVTRRVLEVPPMAPASAPRRDLARTHEHFRPHAHTRAWTRPNLFLARREQGHDPKKQGEGAGPPLPPPPVTLHNKNASGWSEIRTTRLYMVEALGLAGLDPDAMATGAVWQDFRSRWKYWEL